MATPDAGEVIASGYDFYSTPRLSPTARGSPGCRGGIRRCRGTAPSCGWRTSTPSGALANARARRRRRGRVDLPARLVAGRHAVLRQRSQTGGGGSTVRTSTSDRSSESERHGRSAAGGRRVRAAAVGVRHGDVGVRGAVAARRSSYTRAGRGIWRRSTSRAARWPTSRPICSRTTGWRRRRRTPCSSPAPRRSRMRSSGSTSPSGAVETLRAASSRAARRRRRLRGRADRVSDRRRADGARVLLPAAQHGLRRARRRARRRSSSSATAARRRRRRRRSICTIQFWTSRGFAVVDVNYGGSSGYGREYRERLNGQWGIVDVDDVINAARYLAAQGKADADRGSSSAAAAPAATRRWRR